MSAITLSKYIREIEAREQADHSETVKALLASIQQGDVMACYALADVLDEIGDTRGGEMRRFLRSWECDVRNEMRSARSTNAAMAAALRDINLATVHLKLTNAARRMFRLGWQPLSSGEVLAHNAGIVEQMVKVPA